jgi:hypothetical protein
MQRQTKKLPAPTDRALTKVETELHKLETEYKELSMSLLASKEQTRVIESKSLAILKKLMPMQNTYLINIIQILQKQKKLEPETNSVIQKVNINNLVEDEFIDPIILIDSIV